MLMTSNSFIPPFTTRQPIGWQWNERSICALSQKLATPDGRRSRAADGDQNPHRETFSLMVVAVSWAMQLRERKVCWQDDRNCTAAHVPGEAARFGPVPLG